MTLAFVLAASPAVVPAAHLRQAAVRQKIAIRRPFIPVEPAVPAPPTTAAAEEGPPANVGGPGDENVLRNARLAVTDDALLAFFRKRTPPAPDREQLAELVRKLSDPDEKVRDAAQGELTAIGAPALPLVQTAANNSDDGPGSLRARACLEQLATANAAHLVINAARLLAARKPAGACEVLLGYLPYAEDETTYAEIEHALIAVAIRDGKPDPSLLKALQDKVALRRASAAQALAQAGGSACYGYIRPLLKDPKASVRLKAALGLVSAHDAEAIPVLIGLMGELPGPMRTLAESYLTGLAGEWAVTGPKGNDATSRRLRREVWQAWWNGVDPVQITEDLKRRTPTDEEAEKIGKAIEALGDASEAAREQASAQLIALGPKAASLLRRAVARNHPQISPAAARALEAIEKDTPNPLPMAAPRILALRRPAGTVSALINYLPFAESEEASHLIVDVLSDIGVTDGKGDEALVKALEDPLPARRSGAATALCRGRATANLAELRKLLRDKDQAVQLRAAQGLAPLGDKKAVSTLITLLRELPLEQCWEVEDFLSKIAGEQAPTVSVSVDKDSRGRALEAWAKWWTDNRDKTDLTKLDLSVERELGFFLIVENYNPWTGRGRVLEVDNTGKVRWQVDGLSGPYDAHVVRGGNVLVIENQNRLSERDRSGKVVGLDKHFNSCFEVEKLRNGDIFLACRNQLLILDSKGNQKFQHLYNQNSILAARIFRDGSMAYMSYSGHYVKLDKAGKQVKTFNLPLVNISLNGAQILPGDRVIVSMSNNQVREFTADGKVVWEANVQYPLTPYRLSNGNTILSANSQQQIVEIDGKGKIVKTTTLNQIRPYRVMKR